MNHRDLIPENILNFCDAGMYGFCVGIVLGVMAVAAAYNTRGKEGEDA